MWVSRRISDIVDRRGVYEGSRKKRRPLGEGEAVKGLTKNGLRTRTEEGKKGRANCKKGGEDGTTPFAPGRGPESKGPKLPKRKKTTPRNGKTGSARGISGKKKSRESPVEKSRLAIPLTVKPKGERTLNEKKLNTHG